MLQQRWNYITSPVETTLESLSPGPVGVSRWEGDNPSHAVIIIVTGFMQNFYEGSELSVID